jgi:peptidoglycan/LPS O-acetylase OafA/YrhL
MLDRLGEQLTSLIEIVAGVKHAQSLCRSAQSRLPARSNMEIISLFVPRRLCRSGSATVNLARRELAFADYQADSYRPGFDGLRAIGFLLVVTAHIPAVTLFSYLQGWTAVWVFFAISGYLVTALLIREERETGGVAFGSFLIRRVARIVPPYAAAIVIYWIALCLLPPLHDEYPPFMERLPYYLTLMPEYAHTNVFTIFVHTWIIGIEMKFYLFFPPIAYLLIKNEHIRFSVTAATTALLTAQASFLLNAYCAILFGALLAQLLEWPRAYAVCAAATRVPVVVPLGFVAALFVMMRYVEVLPAVAVVSVYLVAYVILQDSAMRRLLSSRPLVYLGQRSYGTYLLHVLAIHIARMAFGSTSELDGWLTFVFALALTIPGAELLHRAVDSPAMEFGRRCVAALQPVDSAKTRY